MIKIASLLEQLKIIENKLQSKIIPSAMQNEVAETAKDVMVDNLVNYVYDPYDPIFYKRKYDQGGLADDSNIETTMIDNNTLKIENIRRDEETNRLVAPVVEYGKGYYSSEIDAEIGPRPFVEKTAEELAKSKARDALKRGLIRQGLDVR